MKLLQTTRILIPIFPFTASFSPSSNIHRKTELYSTQPPYWGSNNVNEQNQQYDPNVNDKSDDEAISKANRWSKFAPDANLPKEEFREQLKENMKADLERRRREDPNRGNQPAKSYLDSL